MVREAHQVRQPARVPPRLVRRLALASLLANTGIVLTGGAVRLTGSGLGCPTWPRCTDDSWTTTPEMGIHGLIEYGNRTLTGVLGVIALAGLVAVLAQRPRRPALVWLAAAVLAGIGVQGAVGGITVRTGLNPWIVGGHFLLSMALIALTYLFWQRAAEPAGPDPADGPATVGATVVEASTAAPAGPVVPPPLRAWAWLTTGVTAALLAVGTVVTGSGPHAGDAHVARNGLDPQSLSQAHADLAFLLLGLAVAGWFALRAVAAPTRVIRAAALLVVTVLAQGVVGLIQYATGLPLALVWLHLLGSCLIWLAAVHLLYTARVR